MNTPFDGAKYHEMALWIGVGCPVELVPEHYDTSKYMVNWSGTSSFSGTQLAAMRQFEHKRAEAYAKRVAGTPELRDEAMQEIAKSIDTE